MTAPTKKLDNKPRTRIQQEKTAAILEAALGVFSDYGFRGATVDRIAGAAGLSKPNLLYYFSSKEAIYRAVLGRLLHNWLVPLESLDADGDPLEELRAYVRRKLEMSREYPQESRLFANEILHGAPHISDVLTGELKDLVDETAEVIRRWSEDGKIAPVHPHHLIFSIWATTQHYADFSSQIGFVLGEDVDPFPDAETHLDRLFTRFLDPTP
jgi:TetR/AcrR family transcriptional regulator